MDSKIIDHAVGQVKASKSTTGGKVMVVLRVIIETLIKSPVLATNSTRRRLHVVAVLDQLLKGADGVNGTTDDVISVETADKIRRFLSDENLEDFVDIVMAAMAGNIAAVGAETAVMTSRCIFSCFQK